MPFGGFSATSYVDLRSFSWAPGFLSRTRLKGEPMFTDRRRILVIANETVEGDVLYETIRFNASEAGEVDVLVIAPALNSRMRHWISDEDEARRRAELRLATCVRRLAARGIEATGWGGDADPLQAI